MRVYQDNRGRFRTLQNPIKAGGLMMDASNIVQEERIIPSRPFIHQPLPHRPRRVFEKGQIVYLTYRGIIFWADVEGKFASGDVKYKNLWPVLKNTPLNPLVINDREISGGIDGLVDRIFSGTLSSDDITAIDSYMIRADNFFVLNDRAWWADRFNLYSGVLTDGKNFKGTTARVQGVPKNQDPQGDYNHINRVTVWSQESGYRMLTEERRMKIKGLGSGYWNYRCVVNEYQSADLINWSFVKTVFEDATLDKKDHSKKTPIPGLPVNYKARVLEHLIDGAATEFSTILTDLYPQPPALEIRKQESKFRAFYNKLYENRTAVSNDGIDWELESRATQYAKDGSYISNAAIVSPGK